MSNTSKKLIIKSDHERIVSGIIAEPLTLDVVNDFYSREGVLRMYYDFVKNKLQENVDKEHNNILTGSEFIRTGIALANDPDGYPEGAWFGECKIKSDEDWEAVLKGELNGFSVQITTTKVDVVVGVQGMISASGLSEISLDGVLPEHAHEVFIKFDESGRVSQATVSEVLGHTHEISRSTATESFLGHSHRLILGGE